MRQKSKWRFAIGTTSRVPDSGGLHYVIVDFDDNNPWIRKSVSVLLAQSSNSIIQRTPHGWHLYTDIVLPLDLLVRTLKEVRADNNWIRIGKIRGYYFLADKNRINFPWPVEHMVLHDNHPKE